MEIKGKTQIIKAQAPMAEMLSYANDLTSITQGLAAPKATRTRTTDIRRCGQ